MEEYKVEVEYHFSAINNELYTLKQGVANGTLRVVGEKVDLYPVSYEWVLKCYNSMHDS